MYFSTTVNKPFTEQVSEARPLSHAAAAVLLGTSIYAVHKGAEMALTAAPGLALAMTCAIVGMEWLQWTSLGRITKLEEARQFSRAGVLKLQCMGIGGLQTILYTIAVVGFAKAGGADWSQGWPLFGAIAIAALYAGLNFVAKWTSCDKVETPEAATASGPHGGARAHDSIFGDAHAPATVTPLKARVPRNADDRPFRTGLATPTPVRQPRKAMSATSEAARQMALKRWATA